MQKINIRGIQMILSSLLFIGSFTVSAYSSSPDENVAKLDFFHTFSGDLSATIANANEQNKFGVMLFFSTQHCRFCHRMKTTVFNQPSVQTYFKTNFQLIELDIESDQMIINGQQQRVSRMDFAKSHRVRLTPTIAFLDHQGELAYRQVGMIADPQEFIWLGEYVLSGQTSKQSFASFKMNKRKRPTQ